MKIFLISTFFHPVTGGVESHVYSLATELTKLGHEVTVLTSNSTKNGPRFNQKESNMNGFKVHRFLTWFSLSYFHKFYPGILTYLLRNDFDIVHVHNFRKLETYFALFAARLKGKKVILTTHNPVPLNNRSRWNALLITLHDWTAGKLFTRFLDKIICIVKSEEAYFQKEFFVKPQKLITIPNGLDMKFFQPGNPENFYKENGVVRSDWKGLVIACCRLHQTKGIQNLRQAVANSPEILFYIIGGDDGYLPELKRIFAQYPNIIITGHYLPTEKIIDALAAADIYVMPSNYEPFGIILLEAMSQGCPIIATNQGGPATLIHPTTGILIDPIDQQAWQDKINYLIDHPIIRKKMGKSGQDFVQDYRWSELVKKVLEVYNS